MTYQADYRQNHTAHAAYGANPLCDKLRARFARAGNKTLGEVALLRAMAAGFNPYETEESPYIKRGAAERKAPSRPATVAARPLPKGNPEGSPQGNPKGSLRVNPEVSLKGSPQGRGMSAAKRVAPSYAARRTAAAPTAAARATVGTAAAGLATAGAPALRGRAVPTPRTLTKGMSAGRARTRYVPHETPFPLGRLVVVVICALLLAFVVYSGVQISEMSREISNLQKQAASLSMEEKELELELEGKNDLRVIEKIATEELGMVKRDQILQKHISLSTGDRVEIYEEDQTAGVRVNLLSAIGKKFDALLEYLD
ncbi:MAG: hypothetical protein GX303_05690 [Clostridiales bacterium]|nr:hypothetical protein [Clostridiales bacterium]